MLAQPVDYYCENWLQANEVQRQPLRTIGSIVQGIQRTNTVTAQVIYPPPASAIKAADDEPKDWNYYSEEGASQAKFGNIKKAQELWLAALHIAETFGESDGRLPLSLINVAESYIQQKNYCMAEMYCKRAAMLYEKTMTKYHLDTANALNSLAGIYYSQQRYEDAQPISIQVLTIYNKMLGPNHPDVGMAANNLAMVYHAQRKYPLAEMMYERAYPIRKVSLGLTCAAVAALMENYANVLDIVGHDKKSEQIRAELRGSGIWHVFDFGFESRLAS
jgi:tetratricopeptide (TPR) repeat protein